MRLRAVATSNAAAVETRARRKTREGIVVSDKMQKTVIVLVRDTKPHPLYKKVVRTTTRYKAHDEAEIAGVGDRVRIMETRPLSKEKRWRVAEVVEKAR